MPKQTEKILKYIHGEKLLKSPFAIYLDLECLLKKEESCQNNPEKSYTEKKAIHEPSGWVMFTSCSFDEKVNKINYYYRGKDCIDNLCKKLKKRAMKIINYEKKEMILLTKEENKSCKIQEACHITYVKKSFVMIKMMKIILIEKRLKTTAITQENLEELLIANAI